MLAMAAWSIFALQPATAHPGEYLDFSRALRVDFELGGDAAGVGVFFRSLKQEPHWAGPLSQPVDPFDYGSYRFRVYAARSGELLFSQGFSGLFEEWQATAESAHRHRSFQHAARFPFPKVPVRFVLEMRRRDTGRFVHLAQRTIDPADPLIVREPPENCRVHPLRIAGTPGESLDIAVVAEGYREREMGKFRKDAARLTDYLLQQEPFRSHRHRISIRAVEAISQESGTDVPSEGIYRNTALNSSYSTFGVERYLTVPEAWRIYDYAAAAPSDQVFVLVNTPRYGGGGFYNHYTAGTADHGLSPAVFVHELGHGFAGLGDEYYESEVTFSDFYDPLVEPWEPNISTGVDFQRKWGDLLEPGTPVPTPRTNAYAGVVGMFEGGGYMAKGMYSPVLDCRMKSNEPENFCPVCRRAIEARLLYLFDQPVAVPGRIPVSRPPAGLDFDGRFEKYLLADSLPVLASGRVADEALLQARHTLRTLSARRPELAGLLARRGVVVAVLARDEGISTLRELRVDMPEMSSPDVLFRALPAGPQQPLMVCAEENLMGFSPDRHRGEDMLVRVFAESLFAFFMAGADTADAAAVKSAYQGMREDPNRAGAYLSAGIEEYWIRGVERWFNLLPEGPRERLETGPEYLKRNDPLLFEVLEELFPNRFAPFSHQIFNP
jgi:hypothetical protein